MTYCFDLDGTLLKTEGTDYHNVQPIQERIDKVNELYKNNTILIITARHDRWANLTVAQLHGFGIKYHNLSIGAKLPADYYIDDKAINADEFFKPQ